MKIKGFNAIFCRELRRLWRDKDLRLILFIAPLLGLFIFYSAYSYQAIKDIPTAVVDLDNSQDSREILADIKKADELKVTASLNSVSQMEELIKEGKVIVGIVIPENFGRDVSVGRGSKILVVVDGSNIIYANNASTAMLGITRTIGAQIGIKQLLGKGVHYSQAQQAYMAVSFKDQPWFNPTLNYAFFLVLALSLNIWQQCCTIASSTSVIGEKEAFSWYQVKISGTSQWGYFAAKSVSRITLFMILLLPIYLGGFSLLGQVPASGFFSLLMFSCVFSVAIDGLGTLVSSFAGSSVDATRFGMVIALPSFVISGYTWPLEAMPQWVQKAAWFFPQTWFFQGFNLLVFKDPGWSVMGNFFGALAVMAALCYGASAVLIGMRD